MIIAVLLVALSASDARQTLGGPKFERFAATSDAACPARALRFVTPGDLDLYEQDYIDTLPRRQRSRIAAANHAERRCTSGHGLSCPSVELLGAMAAAGSLDAFVAHACNDRSVK